MSQQLTFGAELQRYGPQAPPAARPSLAESQAYCRHLANTHYENFTVASWLLPRALRQHFYNLYAYCRWSDDLADETAGGAESLALLDWWEAQLDRCYRGDTRHPVFVALAETISEFSIPPAPFADLLVAFRQDQHVTRYQTVNELLEYCRYSANPVGRLVLHLGQAVDEDRVRLSDQVCTGLQLANFCQDVARDWDRGRIYLPAESAAAAGFTHDMFVERRYNAAFRQLLSSEVERAEGFLNRGRPLIGLVPAALRLDMELFIQGGLSILSAIRRLDYNVWARRPTVSRSEQLRLLAGCWWRSRRASQGGLR